VNEDWIYPKPIKAFPDFEGELYIALLGLEDLPPHVALLHQNTLYSLTVKGVEINRDATRLLRKIWKKKQCALLELPTTDFTNKIAAVYSSFQALQPGNSCIDPLLVILESTWNIIPAKPQLHGMLQALAKGGLIKACFVSFESGNSLIIKAYSKSAIDHRISELLKKID
jgi:hypothetical protein